jgi:hypothetical protein
VKPIYTVLLENPTEPSPDGRTPSACCDYGPLRRIWWCNAVAVRDSEALMPLWRSA